MRARWSWLVALVALALAGCGSSIEYVQLARVAPATSSAPTCRGRALSLSAMAFVSATDGWVLASPSPPDSQPTGAEVLATRNAGGAWGCQWRGSLIPDQIAAVDPEHAWVLASQGTGCEDFFPAHHCRSVLLGTTDGTHWSALYRTGEDVEQVDFVSATVGLAAARERSCQEPGGLPPARCPGQVLLTGDGGRQWHVALSTPDPIVAVAASGSTLWVIETRLGLAPKAGGPPAGDTVLASRDGGRSWATEATIGLEFAGLRQQVQLLAGPGGALWLTVLDLDGCAMHGCYPDDVWHSGDGGQTWQLSDPLDRGEGPPFGCGLFGSIGLALDPAGRALAVTKVPQATCQRPAATLFQTGPAGNWAVVHRWPTFAPIALARPAPLTAYALGAAGLARSTNDGRTWAQILPAPAPSAGVTATGATTAYAIQDATDQNAVLATSNGGRSWMLRAHLLAEVTALSFVSRDVGFAVGAPWLVRQERPASAFYATADGGRSWTLRSTLPLRTDEQVNGLWMAGPERGLMLVSTGNSWPQIGGGVAPVTLWRTLDGGRTWAKLRAVPLRGPFATLGAASFLATGHQWTGWLANNGGLEATDDSGGTWRHLPGAPSFDGVDRVTPSFGVGWSDHNGGIWLWRTADGGHHWSRLPLPQALAGHANDMQDPVSASFTNPTVGWLLADSATWRTTDGGATWQEATPSG